jgi:hypothetical protein
MSNSRRKSLVVPDGWADVFVRTLIALVVAFVTLNLKEWMETREWDIPACAIDGSAIALGTFVFYAILEIAAGGARRTEDRVAVPAAR